MRKNKRLLWQSAFALLQNANFRGFVTGKIYQGAAKNVCVPGLNCYSCPGALGACPLGALQNALGAQRFRLPYYVVGLILFFGSLLGRVVCGFLCPFGLLQDLLYRVPVPKKIKAFRLDRPLRLLKYAVLIALIVLPLIYKLTPFFCKYLCPSGTLSGVLVLMTNPPLSSVIGSRWFWKLGALSAVLLLSLWLCRPFCKYLCPLGAIYGLCNSVSAVRLSVDSAACVQCGKCAKTCPMQVNPVRHPNDPECIRCGECAEECPAKAIRIGFFSKKKKR